jgi:hypothetical protein
MSEYDNHECQDCYYASYREGGKIFCEFHKAMVQVSCRAFLDYDDIEQE